MTRCTWSVTRYLATVTRFFFFFDNTKMPLVGPYDLKTGLKVQIKALHNIQIKALHLGAGLLLV